MNKKLTSVLFLSLILFFITFNPSQLMSQLKPSDASYDVVKKAYWLAVQDYKQKIKDGYSIKPPVDPTGTFYVNANGQMDLKTNNPPVQNNKEGNITKSNPTISIDGTSPNSNVTHGTGQEKDVLAAAYIFSQSTTTYTSINTTGTLITSGCDDSYLLNYPIGFTFNFNGTAYTAFCVSCNGWMNLGTTGTNTYYTPICTGSTPATFAPFARDLYGNATGNGIYYQTTGTAPNRIFTLEWYHWGIYSSGLNELDFQVKLYEATGVIQFLYKPETPTTSITDPEVGFMGTTNADYNTRQETTSWSSTTAGTACSACYFSSTDYPASGLTFTWTPPVIPQYYNTTAGTSSNSFPFNVAAGKETQYLFLAGDFGTPTPAPAGTISKIYVYMSGTASGTVTNLVVKMGQSTITSLPTSIVTGLTTVDSVYSSTLTSTANAWMPITLQTPFTYNPAQSLIVDIYQCATTASGMTVWNSTLTGGRRNYINEASCVATYGGQDASVLNFGIDVAPGMSYSASSTVQLLNGLNVNTNSTNNQIVQMQVTMNGSTNPISITSFNLGTNGSTNPATDITNAKLYYTGTTNTFSTTTLFGTVASPNGTFTIAGSQAMSAGTNYFWLTYDVPSGATILNLLDAQCNSITGSGTMGTIVPSTVAPAGNSPIDKYCMGTYATNGSIYCLYISGVQGTYINNTSGCDPNGNFPYAFTNYAPTICDTVTAGGTYRLIVTRPCTTNQWVCAAWFDWNHNFSFADTGKYFAFPVLASGVGLVDTINITIPLYASLGKTRMRVRNDYYTVPPASASCTALSYGETEDYALFIKSGAPLPPTLISPANNSTGKPLTDTLVWSTSTGALSYRVQLSTDSTFNTNLIVNDSTVTATSRIVTVPNYLTKYYWRVNAKNAGGTSGYSTIWNFTTMPTPPALVNLMVIPGGFYNTSTSKLNMKDTIRIILVDSATCTRVDSVKVLIDSVTFSATPTPSFSIANTGKYYICVFHRNHLAISSAYTYQVTRGSTVSYNFTDAQSKTYGGNVIQVATGVWGMVPGDANQDGYVDGLDQLIWIAQNGYDGYRSADFNGDLFVDALDQLLWIAFNGYSSSLPCNFVPLQPGDHYIKSQQEKNNNEMWNKILKNNKQNRNIQKNQKNLNK